MDPKPPAVKATVPPPPSLPAPAQLNHEESKLPESSTDSNTAVAKKTQFRKYLSKSGFKSAVIRAFVALYEDDQKPDDPLSWIFGFMGLGIPTSQILQSCQDEAAVLRGKIDILQQEHSKLKAQLEEKEATLEKDKDPFLNGFDLKTYMETLSDEDEFTNLSPRL